ncbi:ABC-2 transporter permease [Bifidobacterium sp. ESL0764]|uniref:ABC-2 transporter permease n=1 Tax=Bifidobacterium sp. ESL0764 TaxID=2983228 RepID=UPI0023F762F1|nr:ABC-2 transporter permease [Bifidobacterium sp. ESL0764]WEV66494.1 ABC-2 transporter permease [Bifidobacterium sp. ESL0764]
MDSKQIGKAFRIDIYKVLAWGSRKSVNGVGGSVWLLVSLPLIFAIIARITGNEEVMDPMSGAVTGMLVFVSAMTGMIVFSYEDQTGSGKLNGLLPATRANQVVGRYVLTLIAVAIAVVLQAVCGLIMYTPQRMNVAVGLTLLVLIVAPILASLYLPIGYRFPATKAMGYALILLFVIGALMAVVALTVPDAVLSQVITFVTGAKLGPIPWVAIIGLIVAVVMYILSCRLSMHIYERKEL